MKQGTEHFRVLARRNRLLAAWAAQRLGLAGAAASKYVADVVRIEVDPAAEVPARLLADLRAHGVAVSDDDLAAELDKAFRLAHHQLVSFDDPAR